MTENNINARFDIASDLILSEPERRPSVMREVFITACVMFFALVGRMKVSIAFNRDSVIRVYMI
jgi:hypothetical protein